MRYGDIVEVRPRFVRAPWRGIFLTRTRTGVAHIFRFNPDDHTYPFRVVQIDTMVDVLVVVAPPPYEVDDEVDTTHGTGIIVDIDTHYHVELDDNDHILILGPDEMHGLL